MFLLLHFGGCSTDIFGQSTPHNKVALSELSFSRLSFDRPPAVMLALDSSALVAMAPPAHAITQAQLRMAALTQREALSQQIGRAVLIEEPVSLHSAFLQAKAQGKQFVFYLRAHEQHQVSSECESFFSDMMKAPATEQHRVAEDCEQAEKNNTNNLHAHSWPNLSFWVYDTRSQHLLSSGKMRAMTLPLPAKLTQNRYRDVYGPSMQLLVQALFE